MAIATTLLPHLSLLLILSAVAVVASARNYCYDENGGGPRGADLIRHVCEETRNYDLCVSSLISRPGSSNFRYMDLGKAAHEAALDSAIDTRHEISKTINGSLDSPAKVALITCGKQFDQAINIFVSVENYFKSDGFNKTCDYNPVMSRLWNGGICLDECGVMINKERGVETPLKERVEKDRQLSNNADVITGFYVV